MTARRLDAAFAIALVVLIVVLYRKVTRLWWTYDDAYNLHLVIENRLRLFFTDGALWPQKLFTPMEPVSFRAQLSAFGLATERWFAAQIALFTLSALAVYAAARAWFAPAEAFVSTTFYVVAVPIVSLVPQLSATHYFIAIALASVAVILHMRGHRLLSALFYLVAMLAKETVIPLAVVLFFLERGDWRQRARHVAPHIVALAIYMAWRRAVIGTIAGGYGWAISRGEWPSLLASLPKKMIVAMAGAGLGSGIALVVLLVIGALLALRNRHAIALFVVAMIVAVGPILPVSKEMHHRYVLMPLIVLSFAFVAGIRTHKRLGVLMLIAPLLALVVNRQEWSPEYARIKRMSDEGRTFWDMPPNTLLRDPIMPPAAMGELEWLKTQYAHRPAGAAWFFDDIYLCANDVAGKRVWQFVPQRRGVEEVTRSIPDAKRAFCASVRDAPLSADFHYRNDALFWTFGPYRDGQYRVVFANGVQAFDVPRSDGFRLPGVPGLTMRVAYKAPAGWVTYSPEIALDFRARPTERWSRP